MSTLPSNVTVVIFDGHQCETIRCYGHDDLCEQPHGAADGAVRWGDEALSAKPHSPPLYWVHKNFKGTHIVMRGDGIGPRKHVAYFEPSHPDPERAAESHARELNEGRWTA